MREALASAWNGKDRWRDAGRSAPGSICSVAAKTPLHIAKHRSGGSSSWARERLPTGAALGTPLSGFTPASIALLSLDGDKVSAVTGFLTADLLRQETAAAWLTGAELFGCFGSARSAANPRRTGLSGREFTRAAI